MLKAFFCLALAFLCLASVTSMYPHQRVYLETSAKVVPEQWLPVQTLLVPVNHKFNVIFALKQQNVDKLQRIFEAVSDPKNPQYGQYLTIDQLTALIAPSTDSIAAVAKWLATHGIFDHQLDANKDFMHADIPLSTLSEMLNVKFTSYIHKRTGRMHVTTTDAYSVPAEVGVHLDFIVGFNGFPSESRKRNVAPTPLTDDFQVGPHELRRRYNISGTSTVAHPKNKQAVAEFQGEYYAPDDLKAFMNKYYPTLTDPSYWTATVKGTNQANNPSTEGSLDIEYIMGVAPGIPTEFWSMANFDFYSDLTRWITEINNDPNSPWVHSVSYGSQGGYPTQEYQTRFSTEMQKIGARGISIIFASGDSGTGCNLLCSSFEPSFPATSPYVTSVGATHFLQYGVGAEGAVTQFSSGGGMSWYDAIPSYQQAAVDTYFKTVSNLPASSFYNRNGRGTPDVAALGIGYTVLQGGQWGSVGGTSASAPTFAALVSLLNDVRLRSGKPTLGFLNPWLYQTASVPGALWDVVQGDNQYSCCWTGFSCNKGWDPVTGLGTPNFPVLKGFMP